MNKDFEYTIIVNGECVYTSIYRGLAEISWDSIVNYPSSPFSAEFLRKYIGDNHDPVLHGNKIQVLRKNNVCPPCPLDGERCEYLKSEHSKFYATARKTSLVIEVMSPYDRCGWKLKPGHMGGAFCDYDFCNRG